MNKLQNYVVNYLIFLEILWQFLFKDRYTKLKALVIMLFYHYFVLLLLEKILWRENNILFIKDNSPRLVLSDLSGVFNFSLKSSGEAWNKRLPS